MIKEIIMILKEINISKSIELKSLEIRCKLITGKPLETLLDELEQGVIRIEYNDWVKR